MDFREARTGELLRTPLPRTRVNRLDQPKMNKQLQTRNRLLQAREKLLRWVCAFSIYLRTRRALTPKEANDRPQPPRRIRHRTAYPA
jgi:hypothetical protein